MARRREFKGAALAVLGRFVSRNNDVGGYWALGKLCRLAQVCGTQVVRIDLMALTITPANSEFSNMIRDFHNMLMGQITARKLPVGWLQHADIVIAFSEDIETTGTAFECTATLIPDLGHNCIAKAKGNCWPHDPDKESKSNRAG